VILAALAIEQFPDTVGPTSENFTAKIPLFHGLGSMRISPADLLLLGVVLLALAKRGERSSSASWGSPLRLALLLLLGAVVLGTYSGRMHHGELRVSLMETRPYIYLVSSCLLASTLVTNRAAVRAVLWAIVIAAGLKATQGLLIFFSVRHMSPRPEAVLGHEEALFFGVFIMLAATLWLFDVPGRLRTTATSLLPLVMAADLANSRRAGWLVLGGGFVVLAALALRSVPSRRHLVIRLVATALVGAAVYLPAFWNKSGGLAQPARAVRSIVAPSMRDLSSDVYRIQEDANLNLNIRNGGLLGVGFGVPIDYALPITDISDIDPLIDYVPHNGVLYVLMRMGLLGGIAMWTLVGVGMVTGCRLARTPDRELAVVGAVLVCALVGYTLEGAIDQGFFFYRIAFVIGTLLGLAEAANQLQRRAPGPAR
jgi:hypothetical protein